MQARATLFTIAAAVVMTGVTASSLHAATAFPDAIAVLRVGNNTVSFNFDGPDADATNDYLAQKITIDYYSRTSANTLLGSVVMPVGSSGVVLTSRNDDHDGHLNLSPNGQYLTFGGYAGNPGDYYLAGTSGPRAIGRVDAGGNMQVATLNGAYNGTTINAALTKDGNTFWTAGSNAADLSGGIRYVTPAGVGTWTTTDVSPTPTNGPTSAPQTQVSMRNARFIHEQLYITTASGGSFTNRGAYLITQNGQVPTLVNQPGQVVTPTGVIVNQEGTVVIGVNADDGTGKLFPKSDVLFVDLDGNGTDETAYSTGGKEDIEKWNLNGSTWQRTERITMPSGVEVNAMDYRIVSSGVVDLFFTVDTGLYRLRDSGGAGALFSSPDLNTASTRVVQSTALWDAPGTGSEFRGLAVVPEPTSLATIGLGAAGLLLRRSRSKRVATSC